MSSWRSALAASALSLVAAQAVQAQATHRHAAQAQATHRQPAQGPATSYSGIGRAAKPAELAAWDIDVRPDFKGLPPGAGSVTRGMQVWESQCASCHGVFGESNQVFAPIVGGTTQGDIATGRVARLTDASFPGRTTLMKLSTVSTLWDYVRRAMPWANPKSLPVEDVYAVTAYILHLGGIVPEGFVLSDRNIADVQSRLPNRHGMTTAHAMWPGAARPPDVQGHACMTGCSPEPRIASTMPDHARNAHGNLAQQQRLVGPQRGADTTRPPAATLDDARHALAAPPAAASAPAAAPGAVALAQQNACMACHGIDTKLVGPSFGDIAARYAGRPDAAAYLAGKIRSGGAGTWGDVPMPPQSLAESEALAIASWIATGARR